MDRIASIQIDPEHTTLRPTRLIHGLDVGPHQTSAFRLREFNFHYLTAGKLLISRNGVPYELDPGAIFFGFPGEEIRNWSDIRHSVYHSHFGLGSSTIQVITSSLPDWARLTTQAGAKTKHTESMLCIPDILHIRRQDKFSELFAAMMDDQKSALPGARLAYQAHFMLFLRDVSAEAMTELLHQNRPDRSTKVHIHVNRTIRHIDEHLAERITMHDLAVKLRLNSDYLGRIFRKGLGMNIGTYILRRRIAKAIDLLLSANMSVKEIAARVGFRDPLYFSRIFRRHTGSSPTEYVLRNSPSLL